MRYAERTHLWIGEAPLVESELEKKKLSYKLGLVYLGNLKSRVISQQLNSWLW